MSEHRYDMVVIGAGPAGENAADYAVKHGLTAAVVETDLVGGECSYWACMPSKALLRPIEVLNAVKRVPATAAALSSEDATVDVERVFSLRDAFTSGWDDQGQVDWLGSAGIDLYRGHGRISGEEQVTVTDQDGEETVLTASRAVVVATGSAPSIPPIDGLRDIRTWDNRDITAAHDVPARLLILGGGVVGVEMAQAWQGLGAQVTLIERADRLISTVEPFAGEEIEAALEHAGVDVRIGVELTRASRVGTDGPVTGTLDDGTQIEADEILVSVGRRPLTDDIGLDTVGLQPGGPLETDEHLRVRGVDGGWLYAVGDVNGRALLTHQGKYQGRLVGRQVATGDADEAWADHAAVPSVIFTDPNVASVGLTVEQARDTYADVRAVSYQTHHTAGGALLGEGTGGTAQIVVDTERQVIVGATFVGQTAGEMLHAATIAIVGEVPISTLWHAVPAFPTVSEVWLRLLESYAFD